MNLKQFSVTRISPAQRNFRILVALFTLAILPFGAAFGQGAEWSQSFVPPNTPPLNGVASNGSVFVAVGEDGSALRSSNPDSWNAESTGGVTETLNDVVWDRSNAQFIAVGQAGTILTSPDGVTWTEVSEANIPTAADLHAITALGDTLIAAGGGGTILTSSDGVAWSLVTGLPIPNSVQFYGLGVTGEGKAYAVGSGGVILESSDGQAWVLRTTPVANVLLDVTEVGSATPGAPSLVVVGESGLVLTSRDGITWTRQNSGGQSTLISVVSTGTRLIAVGAFGSVRTSETFQRQVNGQPPVNVVIGEEWTARTSGVNSWMTDVLLTAEGELVAVTDQAAILTSQPASAGEGVPVELSVNAPVVLNATQTPPVLGVGSTFSARVTVTNGESADFTDAYQLRLVLSSIENGAEQITVAEIAPDQTLPSNSSVEFQFPGISVPQEFTPSEFNLTAQISLTPPTDKEITGTAVSSRRVVVEGPDFSLSNANFPFGIIAEVSDDGELVQFRDVTYDLANSRAGRVAAGEAVQVQVRLSNDNQLSGDDPLVAQYSYEGGIAPGQTVQLPVNEDDRDIVIPNSILGGNYFMIFQVNGDGAIPESGSTPNTLSQTVTISLFDLGVSSPNLPDIPDPQTGPKRLGTNDHLDVVTLTLQNSGSVEYRSEDPEDPLLINLYLSSDDVVDAGDIRLDQAEIESLGAQSSRLVTFRRDGAVDPELVPLERELFVPDLPPGNYSLLAEIEFPEGVTDNNPVGNTSARSVELVGPDLALGNLIFANGATVSPGQPLEGVYATVRNTKEGNIPANKPVLIEAFLSQDQELDLGDDTLLGSFIYSGGLAPGSSVRLPIVPSEDDDFDSPPSLNLPEGVLGGAYFVLISANRLGGVNESDTAPNLVAGAITVRTVDLAVTEPTLSASSVGVNSVLSSVATVVQNRGALNYDLGYTVRIWLSEDDELDPSDRLLDTTGEITEPLEAVSGEVVVFDDVAIPSVAAGPYFILVEVEPSADLVDRNIDDNMRASSIAVQGADIAVADVRIPSPPSEEGLEITGASFVLRNRGDGAVLPVAEPPPGEEPLPGQEILIQVFLSAQTGENVVADPNRDPLLVTFAYSDGLAPGAEIPIQLDPFSLPVGTANGEYSIIGTANLDNNVPESPDSLANNQAHAPVSVGTLDVEISAPVIVGDPAFAGTNTELDQINLSLSNDSGISVDQGTRLSLFLSPAGDTTIENGRPAAFNRSIVLVNNQSLPGFTQSREVTLRNVAIPGNLVEGNYFLIAEAVLPNSLSDRNATNNVSSTAIGIQLPDLQITDVSIPNDQVTLPSDPAPGETVSITDVVITVRNSQAGVVPAGVTIPITVSFGDSDEVLTITPNRDLDGIAGNTLQIALDPTNVEIPADTQGGTRSLIFTINGGDNPVPESNRSNNTRNKQISLFTPERIDLAIDYGYFENTGTDGNWTSVQDNLASGGIAYQSPLLDPGQSATFRTAILGPTTMNAPWKIEAGDASVDVTVNPAPNPPLAPAEESITGFVPVYRSNELELRNQASDASTMYEVEWTFNQGTDLSDSFARLDLDIPTFVTSGDDDWFGEIDNSVVVTNPITPDGQQRSVRTPIGLDVGQQASFEVDVVGPALVSFFVKSDSDPEDTVSFLVDGETQSLPTSTFEEQPQPAIFSGVSDWKKVAFLIGGGEQTLRWVYAKGSEDPNSVVYIDGLAVQKPAPEINIPNRDGADPGYDVASVPPRNVDLAIEDVVATPGVYILDDAEGTGRLPLSVVVGSIGSDVDIAGINANFVSNVEVHLSTDSIYGNADDVILGSYLQTQKIIQGDKLVLSAEINLPFDTPAGNYNVIVRFLTPPQIDEFTLVNNTVVFGPGFEIVRAPDLVARDIDTPSGTYPFHPEETINLNYTITNRGLGTINPDQPFNVTVRLMAILNVFSRIEEASELIKTYDSFDLSTFLPERSAAFPVGGQTRITQEISLPSLRDILVALDFIGNETPEDSFAVSQRKDFLRDFVFYFEIVLDSGNEIVESSETNTFFARATDPLDGAERIVIFNIYPTPGLENYGSFTSQLPFSTFVDPTEANANLSISFFDSEGDQISNLLEYALATDPTKDTALFQPNFPGAPGQFGDVLGRYNVVDLIVPPSSVPESYLTMTFNFNVRADEDIVIRVQGADDPNGPWSNILSLTPPYIDDSGPRSLTGFGGLKDDPVVLAVDGNVSAANPDGTGGIQKVYSARITVRDTEPLSIEPDGASSRFMRVTVDVPDDYPEPAMPLNLRASFDNFLPGVRLAWDPGAPNDPLGPAQGGAFQILRSVDGLDEFEAIGATTGTEYADTTALSFTGYVYRIRLVNSRGASDPTPPTPPVSFFTN